LTLKIKNYFLTSFLLFVCCLNFLSACKNSKNQKNKSNSNFGFKEVKNGNFVFDSLSLQSNLIRITQSKKFQNSIIDFYKSRNYEFVWINKSGINEYGKNLFNFLDSQNPNLVSSYANMPSNDNFKKTFNSVSAKNRAGNDSLTLKLEILFTLNFFEYAENNWQGISENKSEKLDWFINKKKIKISALLDSLLKFDPSKVSSYVPVYRQYSLLKKQLTYYQKIQKEFKVQTYDTSLFSLNLGDTSKQIIFIKKQLYLLQDLIVLDSSKIYNTALASAIKSYNQRNGQEVNGKISKEFIAKLNVPINDLIIKLLINMERCKWVPVELKSDYIVVNIPAFKMYVYQSGNLFWNSNIIVGKSNETSKTIIFNDTLETIVFNPYWNIPTNIIVREILPQIKRNKNYLRIQNLEVVSNSGKHIPESSINFNKYTTHFPYIIRQKPGSNNSLGSLKFLFPNVYDIYLHDTPQKYLFENSSPTFSHGCIRIQEPIKLAKFLLRNDKNFDDAKIQTLLNQKSERHILLKDKVPIFIAYFTAWVDREGKLNFRDDIYKHDQKMEMLLFEK